MPRLIALFCTLIVLVAAACAPSPAPTPTPTKAAPPPAATAAKPAGEATKPVATAAAPATTAPKADVKPLSPPVTVKIGSSGSLTEAFFNIADAKGYFADEGIKAEFLRFQNANEMVPPLGTGELDVGGGATSPALFNAIARGIPIKIVADRSTSLPGRANLAIMVRKDLVDSGQVKDFKDFKGKTVAITAQGNTTEMVLVMALDKAGLKETDVNMVTMGFPDMVAAFSTKAIDISISTDPSNGRAVQQGTAVRWKGEDEVYPNHEPSIMLYGTGLYQNKPEAAKRVAVAYIRGIRDYLDAFNKNINKDQIISIMMDATGIKDRQLYDIMTIMGVDPNGYMNPKSIAADQDWYFGQGQMQQKVDLSKVVDGQFVDYAVERLGKYK